MSEFSNPPREWLGMCSCGTMTPHQCACGGWRCSTCLWQHTMAPGGRCEMAVQQAATDGQSK